jgi:hypothetical protein
MLSEDTAARILRDLADYMTRNHVALIPLPDSTDGPIEFVSI